MSRSIKEDDFRRLMEDLRQTPELKGKRLNSITFREKTDDDLDLNKLNKRLNNHPVFKGLEITNLKIDDKKAFLDFHWCERPPGSGHYEPCE